MADRSQLIEYLRQRVELGDHELYLDTLTAAEFVKLLDNGGALSPSPSTTPVPNPRPGPQPSTSPAALTVLQQEAAGCTACGLHTGRTNSVFARGDAASPIVVVGEAPGEEEDRTGLPFVGRAGKLLDLMLRAVGFPKDSVYICNTLKCRPPGNRNPLPDEIASCNRFLRGQLDAIAP
ncbi:MAG TPA: uracil-DNA glycosylase, partial [Longimicrobiales bacterium]